jgi:RND family efflux transporter MFP subunit
VRVSQPIVREVRDYALFNGQIDAPIRVDLRGRVSGMLDKVLCQPGQVVKKGDLLFVVDPRPYKAELDKAEAEFERTRARRTRWQDELTRVKRQAKSDSILQAEAKRVEGESQEAEASLKAAQAARDLAKLNLEFTLVTAPIDGTILGPVLAAGNVAVADRTSLASLISMDPMYVYFDVDQQTALNVIRLRREGKIKAEAGTNLSVRVGLEDEEDFSRVGQVRSLNIPFDPKTGTARWRAEIPNPDRLLLPGMSARVKLVTSAPYKALLVTDEAPPLWNDRRDNAWSVHILTDQGIVQRRVVKLGAEQGRMRVVQEGIRADDWVVIDAGVEEGMKVTPERVPMLNESSP